MSANILGKPLTTWESHFKKKLTPLLTIERLDQFALKSEEVESMGQAYRVPLSQVKTEDGMVIIPAPDVFDSAPERIECQVAKQWIEDVRLHDYVAHELAQRIGERETIALIRFLTTAATDFPSEEHTLSANSLSQAVSWIAKSAGYPDTLVASPTRIGALEKSEGFVGYWRSDYEERKSKGRRFGGRFLGFDVYWTPFIDEHTVLLLKRSDIRVLNTPLEVRFYPSYQNPTHLLAGENYFGWTLTDASVGKIVLSQ